MPPASAAGAAVTVIVGDEELLVERAVHAVVAEAGAASAETPDVHDVRAADLRPGDLPMLTAPSLFGGGCLVIVRSAQEATKDVAAELASQLAAPPPDVTFVLTHSGAAKNKSLLTGHGGPTGRLPGGQALRRAARLHALRVRPGRAEGGRRRAARAARRRRKRPARAGRGVQPARRRHHRGDQPGAWWRSTTGGRAEATGFTVADRAVEGKLGEALDQLRWALATGVSPVLITSALAQGVRALGRVGTAARARGPDALASELGMPPWKVDRVRQQLRGWTAEGVAQAHSVVAQVDAQVKGEGASPGYALERAITEIVACRSGG